MSFVNSVPSNIRSIIGVLRAAGAPDGRVVAHLLVLIQAGIGVAQVQVHLQLTLPVFHIG